MIRKKHTYKGIILVGGKSERFGSNKALAEWRGKSLLKHAWDLLEECSLDPCIITRSSAGDEILSFSSVKIDLVQDRGPLGGLYTAMACFPDSRLVVLSCDMPLVSIKILKTLMFSHTGTDDITVFARDPYHAWPFPGIYQSRLVGYVARQIDSGRTSMQELIFSVLRKKILGFRDNTEHLANVNTREDLREIEDAGLEA